MITVHLRKPAKHTTITYQGELLLDEPTHRLIRAHWDRPRLDLGYVVFDTGDIFDEHYYTDCWYNIFAIYTAEGTLKGWYCNVTRPASFTNREIFSEDLELDLFVSPDRTTILKLDEDEFAARGFDLSEPATHVASLSAFSELERMAHAGDGVFQTEAVSQENSRRYKHNKAEIE